jgi:hypothetical protein
MWYSFNATSSTLVLNFLQTNATNCYPYYIIWGPYSSVSAGCSIITDPSTPCSSAGGAVLSSATPTNYVSSAGGMYYNLLNGDPGNYIQLNGLSTTAGNNTYLIQMVNLQCGGPGSAYAQFCIGVNNLASNSNPSGASVINQCGTQYNGSTQGGYAPSNNGSPSLGNIDNNSSTSCPSSFGGNCNGSNGNDVPFVINNPSYFTFCATANGTYNINFDVVSCTQPQSGAQGAQMAILIGSPSNMTLNQVAPNPMLPSSAIWTSSNFSLAAGQCAYLVVDGFAGDQCTYSYTLNNVSGGCQLLPIELVNFIGEKNNGYNKLSWTTATEKNNAYFTLEKSSDGIHFEVFQKVAGAGNSYQQRTYELYDDAPFERTYYQLSQTDYDGTTKKLGIIVIDNNSIQKDEMKIVPNPAEENCYLYIYSKLNKQYHITITDLVGNVIDEKTIDVESGTNKLELYTSNLDKGMYFVKLQTRYTTDVIRFIKN